MEELIPHEFTHGKNHGKAEGPGYLFDLKIDAKGLESQLDELKHRFWKHISEVHERLMDEFDKKSKQRVFILNQSQVGDPNHHFFEWDLDWDADSWSYIVAEIGRKKLKTILSAKSAVASPFDSKSFRWLNTE